MSAEISRGRRLLFAVCGVGASLLLGAAGSPLGSSAASAAPTGSAGGTAAGHGKGALGGELKAIGPAKASGLTLSLARGPQGIFLVGPNGHSLYVFDKDHASKSACTGACATRFPALRSTAAITTGPVVNAGQVAKTLGQSAGQVTYFGHLLYYFTGDSAPGQTNGIRVAGWHLLGPFGNVMLPRS